MHNLLLGALVIAPVLLGTMPGGQSPHHSVPHWCTSKAIKTTRWVKCRAQEGYTRSLFSLTFVIHQ